MRKFFRIDGKYEFDIADIRALIILINLILVMSFGLSSAWIGLLIAVIGLIKDFIVDRRINSIIDHFSSAILNIYLLCLCYLR